MEINGVKPQINLVLLVKKAIEKTLQVANIPETPVMVRTVCTVLVRIAAEYTLALQDDPKHIQDLFAGFLSNDEATQRQAVQTFGEAFVPKPETNSETGEPKP